MNDERPDQVPDQSSQPTQPLRPTPGPRPTSPPPAALLPPAYAGPVPQAGHRPEDSFSDRAARGRRRFAAGVLAAALVVGGGAGLGGAAVWDALHGDDTATTAVRSTATQARSTSTGASSSAGSATGDATVDGSVESVAQKVLPSVVKIDVSGAQGAGSGSGIILSDDGEILTNNHVVELAGDDGTLTVFFNDGTSASARILGTDPLTDTALIQADGVSGLTPATLGTSGDLVVGQGVVAIGSPFGLESTVTSGIVSALDRPVDVGDAGDGNATVYPAIQTDAAINPGNSGGALVDLAGNLVGINAAIRSTGSTGGSESGSIGLGFAIPIDEVLPIVDEMANGQTPTHARLGVAVANASQQAQELGQTSDGATVQTVNPGSTAENAGIAVGDVITKVGDQLVTGPDSLIATIRSYRPGDQVTVTWTHDGATQSADLTLDSDADVANS